MNVGLSEVAIPDEFELYSSALAQHLLLVEGEAERFILTRTRPTIMVLSIDYHFSMVVVTENRVIHADSVSSSTHGQHLQGLAQRMGLAYHSIRTRQQQPGSNDCGLHAIMNVERYVTRQCPYRHVGSMADRRNHLLARVERAINIQRETERDSNGLPEPKKRKRSP